MDQNLNALDRGWQIENTEHAEIYEIALPFLQTRLNALHTRISYHFAQTLLAEGCGDPEVVIPAILLHDIGWSIIPENKQLEAFGPDIKKPELRRIHEIEGARMAGEILTDLGCRSDRIQEIQKIISEHDSRSDAFNTNDRIVKDADKLWRYTHEGFTIDYHRFGKTKHEHLSWLIESISIWFISRVSIDIAQNEALLRKKQCDIELDWQVP